MFQIRFAIFLTLALSFCLPATLTAQPPEGEFVILSAQYGTEIHHVEVTQRLREAARGTEPQRPLRMHLSQGRQRRLPRRSS